MISDTFLSVREPFPFVVARNYAEAASEAWQDEAISVELVGN